MRTACDDSASIDAQERRLLVKRLTVQLTKAVG